MKILGKLLAGFILVAMLCGIVGVVGIAQLRRLDAEMIELAEVRIPTMNTLNLIAKEFLKVKVAVRNLANPLGAQDPGFNDRQLANIEVARANYTDAMKFFEKLSMVSEEKALWGAVTDQLSIARNYADATISGAKRIAESRDAAEREAKYRELYTYVFGDNRLALDDLIAKLDALIAFDEKYYGKEATSQLLASVSLGITMLIGVTVAAFGVAILLGLILGNSISRSLRKAVSVLDKIAAGDLSERMESKGKDEFRQVAASLNGVSANVSALVADANMLARAAVEGKLATRADTSKHQGDYRKIVEGVNNTLDAVIGPLNVAADYVDKISKGALPPKITDTYSGDFNVIKNNLNVAIDSINALVADAGTLAQAALEGKLATRADASKHQGDYRRIVDGVNKTLDLVITPINETVSILKRLADGDLTLRMTGDYKGDFDILKTALNDSLEAFNDTLRQVNIAVDQVAEGSLQVSQASQSLSQGATEQAASLEEITSSVTEIAGQTKLNTENAGQVNTLANTAKSNAEQGNAQMQNLVVAMGDINKSAEEIKKIVKAIDDIAFQINLLALNANVEAARAGKYGKGFAVVAEEVRNLAVRSANSVKDTTRMVEEAITAIGRGNSLCDLTAKQLGEIVQGAGQVATLAEEVATASKEQAQGLEQITTGLNQIDQVTQANTAASEESASASEELSSQSQQVKNMLSRFKLKEAESRLNNAEVIQMLRAEMAKQGPADRRAPALASAGAHAKTAPGAAPGTALRSRPAAINPADIISLDDDNFGKF
jgi:methyl-accepting chemotaxis protein